MESYLCGYEYWAEESSEERRTIYEELKSRDDNPYAVDYKIVLELLFTQHLAFTAKCVRKCSLVKQKSICEANLGWIFARYWNEVNQCHLLKRISDFISEILFSTSNSILFLNFNT